MATLRDRPEARLITKEFSLLLVAALGVFLALGMTLPVLPYFVRDLGGGDLAIGVVVGSMAVSAVMIRPFTAPAIQNWGFQRLVLLGGVAGAVATAGHAFADSFAVLLALRLLTGAALAVMFVACIARVMATAPAEQRSRASSYFSVAPYLGIGLGPVIGQPVYETFGFGPTFLLAGVLQLAGTLPMLLVTNHRDPGEKVPRFHSAALWPGAVLALGIIGVVAFNAYVPLYVDELRGSNPALMFLAYSGVVLAARIFAGGLPDRIGAVRAGTLATTGVVIGLVIIAAAPSPLWIYVGILPFGAGIAFQYPGLMALTISRVSEAERPAAVSTFTMFFDVATGLGGLVVGQAAALGGYRAAFAAAACCSVLGLILLRTVVAKNH
ncbi:MFS transporter [Cryptosporangium arvum]|uniref:Arabinose efflux permease family protein n=1 Tax=Cryptosporangium arvum DSM 44712 TaxID=927661 RepID=A0A010YNQ9_9ACTN|nr:MFS transporter [Cryptosporangium arvum]EXG81800.1 arabinose efflux permease family protein [Cryptosporangium arvum DSM 44712]